MNVMSIDEIRQQKAFALLEFQEAQERLAAAAKELKDISARLDRLGNLVSLEQQQPRMIDMPDLSSPYWQFVTEESFRSAIAAYNEACEDLAQAVRKKKELGIT